MTYFFYKRRRGAEETICQKHSNFQAKGLLPDRTLESFILKSIERGILSE